MMSIPRIAPLAAVAVALLVLAGAAPAHAGAKARKCAFAKQMAAVDEADALLACQRQALRTNTAVDPACTAAAEAALATAFQQAEANGGCKPTGDANGIAGIVGEFTVVVGRRLQGSCQASGATCSGDGPPCCAGLTCKSRLGQPAVCD
jgi:hypothetical protein